MKVVYIADNRSRANFGCRATSIALSQLISTKHEIVGVISGEYTHRDGGPIFYCPGVPRVAYRLFSKLRGFGRFQRAWSKFISKHDSLRRFFDFVCESPEKSVKNYLKSKPLNDHVDSFDLGQYDFDAIVINGEGTMIMTNPARRESLVFLMFVKWAQQLGKKVYLVNAMFSDCPTTGANLHTRKITNDLLKKCDLVCTRDMESLRYIKKNFEGVRAQFVPDALFTWLRYAQEQPHLTNGRYCLPFRDEPDVNFEVFDFSKPYICVSGSSLAAWNQEEAYIAYLGLIKALKSALDLAVYIVIPCAGDNFLKRVAEETDTPYVPQEVPILAAMSILSRASLYISGRFHPAILASLGGTPCVFMGSNSHKTESLQEMLGYEHIVEFGASPSQQDVSDIVKLSLEKIGQGDELRRKILNVVEVRSRDASGLPNLFN
jgi:polysaccharide pyruvyl transferase WcaK-like protein